MPHRVAKKHLPLGRNVPLPTSLENSDIHKMIRSQSFSKQNVLETNINFALVSIDLPSAMMPPLQNLYWTEIRNRYNQAPHLIQDTTWESDKNTIKRHLQESQESSPFPAGDHKATMNRQENIVSKGAKNQELIQSSTTPDPGYQWESDKLTVRHHKREPRGQSFPSRDPKAHIHRRTQRHSKHKTEKT